MASRFSILQVQGYTTGGSAEHTLILCRGFAAKGWNVVVACPPAENRFTRTLQAEGIEIVPVPLTGKNDWMSFRRIAGLVRERRIDCVHTHSRNADWVGLWAGRAAGAPLNLATLHGWLGERPGSPEKCVKSRAHAWTLRMAADHVIAISQAVKDHAVADYGLPEDLISVVHNGSEPAVHDSVEEPRTGAERVVVSIGSLHPSKGFLDLIDVADRVLKTHDRVTFMVLGEGPQRPALERRIADLSLQGRVVLAGHRDDAADVLRRADVLVTTSEWEGFGRTITEAMAWGVPVVARRVGAMPEIVEQGRTGFLCRTTDDFAAALTQLLASPSLAARMGAEGRVRFERCFTSVVNVAATAQVIESQLAGRIRESSGEDAAIA